MRIIKTHGRSVVVRETDADNKLKRKLIPKAKARHGESEAETDIHDYLSQNEKFFLAQWGSMFDKMLSKHNKPYRSVYNAREKAGNAFFKYWKENNLLKFPDFDEQAFNKKWQSYVHPYNNDKIQDDPKDNSKKPSIIKPWFKGITGKDSLNNINWGNVAEAVYQHLYQNQKKLNNEQTFDKGLIKRKSDAITCNARNYEADSDFKALSQTDQRHIISIRDGILQTDWNKKNTEYQLDSLVKDLAKKEQALKTIKKWQGNTVPYLKNTEATACLKAHYVRIFGEIPVSKAKINPLWHYHSMMETALKKRYPKRLLSNKIKRGQYPITTARLHSLAVAIEQNRAINFAIRLGKTIHYEAGKQGKSALLLATGKDIENHQNSVAQSDYWLSKGQTEIKQKEAFVRHWLSAIAVANVTLERLLDPMGKTLEGLKGKGDFLTEGAFVAALLNLHNDDAARIQSNQQVELLFGKEHNLYDTNNSDQLIMFSMILRVTLAQIRHNTFHYKKMDDFITALDALKDFENNKLKAIIDAYITELIKTKFTDLTAKSEKTSKRKEITESLQPVFDTVQQNINQYIEKHQNQQHQLAIDTLRSAHIENYLNRLQIDMLIDKTVDKSSETQLTLPRFSRLLQRAVDTDNKPRGTKTRIIRVPNIEENQRPGYHCSFICLKRLYEKDFADWLVKQEIDKLNAHLQTAKARTADTQQGNTISKTRYLRDLKAEETLQDYFNYIARESAQEASLQQSKNRYESSKSGARKHSNTMDNFKMDFLVLAFHDYLDQLKEQLGQKLKTLGTEAMPTANPMPQKLDDIQKDRTFTPKELSRPNIYLVLHLMPIEFINHLSLQIKKQHVLTGGEEFDEIATAINLYLDMHDAGLGLQNLEDNDALKAFYDETTQKTEFNKRFKQNETDQALIPVRGLREILRFGNTSVLNTLFANNQVTQEDIDAFDQLKQKIARFQVDKKIMHDSMVEERNLPFNDAIRYKRCNEKIVSYRELKNKIYLHNPKQAHQLMVAIIGRMISYAQLYERDIYFVMLALLFLQGKTLDDKQDDAFEKLINKGQVITAINKRQDKNGEIVVSKAIEETTALLLDLFDIAVNSATRNNLAHINYLRSTADNASVPDFTDILNQVRGMMAYDRKLKNAVVKSLRDLCERHNIIVNFRMNQHQLQQQSIEAKTIYHLGTTASNKPPICEKLHSQAFVATLESLFPKENKNKTTANSR